jgi:hypothetical protein
MSSGNHFAYNNSFHLADGVNLATIIRAFYAATASVTLQNNIVQMDEASASVYCVYISSSSYTITSDYNCFYGTGAGFNVGSVSTTPYPTLANWQSLGYDTNSLDAEPGFMSAADLHINPTFDAVDGAGVDVGLVTSDIDGDPRGTPPDMGADEYEFEFPAPTAMTIYPDVANGDITIRWDAVVGANSYKVYSGDTEDFDISLNVPIGTTAATSYVDNDVLLSVDAIKFYKVVATVDPPAANSRTNSAPRFNR